MGNASDALRQSICDANRELSASGLVMDTFGNVSGLDAEAGIFYIKASGVPYDVLTPEHMVPVSLESGEALETDFRPSSDTPTHLEIYRAFGCGGIAHTHSTHATTLAQALLPVPCRGTTHADFFRGEVPVTRDLTDEEIREAYEVNTGRVIVEAFREKRLKAAEIQGVLVARHGPFTWGRTAHEAVRHSIILEELARMEILRRSAGVETELPSTTLVEKHFLRKHGPGAYYGQG